jgi:SM-20-related protein
MTSKSIAADLGKTGLCICPGFLSPKALANTADDFDELRARFAPAGIGRGETHNGNAQVRNDETYWLDRQIKNRAQNFLWRKLDLLQRAFNRSLFLGLSDFSGHYASYPEGGFYKRHKDCFHNNSDRVVSLVLYLNRDWKTEDGGRLRVYASMADGGESFTDVDPVGGTMVCFMSSESEHEVLQNHRPRASLTGWFK